MASGLQSSRRPKAAGSGRPARLFYSPVARCQTMPLMRCHPTSVRDVILKRAVALEGPYEAIEAAIRSPRSCPLNAPGVPNQPHLNSRLTYRLPSGFAAVQDDLPHRATAIKQPLLQLGVHRDLRVEHLRNRTSLLRRFGILLKRRGIGTRHLADNINVTGSNRPP